ncbi:MAG: DUF1207 domain-containing protein [Spirochaetales bacterium]|nr:DUF1207 domain-containing protein [Spirochaetales bacterium]
MKTHIVFSILYLLPLFLFSNVENVEALDINIFPEQRLSENIIHNSIALSPETSFSFGYSSALANEIITFGAGGKIPFFSFKITDDLTVDSGAFGVISSIFAPFSASFDFIHVDYFAGAYSDIAFGNWLFELNVFHISSHLGDDLIKNTSPEIKNVGIESVRLYINRKFGKELYLSAGYEGKFGARPEDVIFYRNSMFLGFNLQLPDFWPYPKLNIETELFSFSQLPNMGVRFSIPLNPANQIDEIQRTLRHEIFLAFYSGYSKKGFFYNSNELLLTGGFAFQL